MFSQTRLARLLRRITAEPIPPEGPAFGGFSVVATRRTYARGGYLPWLRQWWRGEAEGGMIGQYAPETARRKRAKNLPDDRVVLYETGDLYAKTELKLESKQFVLRVNVPYARYLAKRYGERIWGLSAKAQEEFLDAYKDTIIKHYKRRLYG